MIYKFDSWKPMTADTQSQIDAIFNQVAQYNQQHDTWAMLKKPYK